MRAYFFCNYYLSSIQQGIQAAHCLADMFTKYQEPTPTRGMLYEWAIKHKTMIVLNGGNSFELNNLVLSIRSLCSETGYPYEVFTEDEPSLNNATTCVGIVVPEQIYKFNEYEKEIRKPLPGMDVLLLNPIKLNKWERMIADIVGSAPLAR